MSINQTKTKGSFLVIEVSSNIIRSVIYGLQMRDFYKGIGKEDWILINSEILCSKTATLL